MLSEQKNQFRSIFLSDFHIGAKAFDSAALLKFLRNNESDYLFLVGDIIDGWKLNKRWYWHNDYTLIIDELIRKKENGTKIIYLPGNHDDEIRKILSPLKIQMARQLGIKIKDQVIHKTADNKRFLVLHGDQFDRKILRGPLSKWSDELYDLLIEWVGYNKKPEIVVKGKLKPFSLAKALQKSGKWTLKLLNNFEASVYKMTKSKNLDGLICGHTHIPVIKQIKDVIYANSGDWMRSGHTALIEEHNGKLKLIDCPSSYHDDRVSQGLLLEENLNITMHAPSRQYRKQTLQVIYYIKKIWPQTSSNAKNKTIEPAYQEIFTSLPAFSKRLANKTNTPLNILNLMIANNHYTPSPYILLQQNSFAIVSKSH